MTEITDIASLEETIEDVCKQVDEFAKIPLKLSSSFYNFQQEMIKHVRAYRNVRNEVDQC